MITSFLNTFEEDFNKEPNFIDAISKKNFNEIQEGMTSKQMAEIISDKLIENLKKQLEDLETKIKGEQ